MDDIQTQLDTISKLNATQSRKIRRLEKNATHQRNLLAMCVVATSAGVIFSFSEKSQDISPESRLFLQNIILTLVTGSGITASTTLLSSKKGDEDDESD